MSLIQGMKPNGLPDAVKLDADGALITTGTGGGGATLAEIAHPIENDGGQDYVVTKEKNSADIKTAIDSVVTNTLIGSGWFPSQMVKYTSVGSGIDLLTAVPGKTAVAILGSRTATNGSVIQLQFAGNAPGELIDLNFGPGYIHYGQWAAIDETSTAGCFPLFVLFV